MFVVAVTFEIRPGGEARFLELVKENAVRSLADEPGCRRFDVCTSDERPGAVFLYEIYDDAAAFDAHKATPHYHAFSTATGPLVAGKQVSIWRLEGARS